MVRHLLFLSILAACSRESDTHEPGALADGGLGDGGIGGGSGAERHHPDGWSAPDVHGTAMKLAEEDCTSCHGKELDGDVGPSCDTCHSDGWRADCTYCHGGVDDNTGAPPRGIDGVADDLAFGAHGAHVTGTMHAPYACAQCHLTPTDVTSEGHVLDGTAGIAETDFSAGISSGATWDGGTCANVGCHGDGRNPGSMTVGETATCGGCHPVASVGDYGNLSGEHGRHVGRGYGCDECHAPVAGPDDTLADVGGHVDGDVDVGFTSGMVYDNGRCTGTCHGEDHGGRGW